MLQKQLRMVAGQDGSRWGSNYRPAAASWNDGSQKLESWASRPKPAKLENCSHRIHSGGRPNRLSASIGRSPCDLHKR